MTKDTMKAAAVAADLILFDNWFDPIEDGVRAPAGRWGDHGRHRSSLCAQQAGLAERSGQKIVLQRQLADLGVQPL